MGYLKNKMKREQNEIQEKLYPSVNKRGQTFSFLFAVPQAFDSVFYFTLCFLSVPLDLDIKYKAILMGATFLIVSTDRAHVTFLTTAKVLCHVSDFVQGDSCEFKKHLKYYFR